MCGRFSMHTSLTKWCQLCFSDWIQDPTSCEVGPRYNLSPGQHANVCVRDTMDSHRIIRAMKWGITAEVHESSSSKVLHINARSESIESKKAFAECFRRNRCLVPVNGFFEWQSVGRKKQPYYFSSSGEGVFALAAIWKESSAVEPTQTSGNSFCIITTKADHVVSTIHNRMPVIVHPRFYEQWLDPSERDPSRVQELIQLSRGSTLRIRPVSRMVNKVSLDSVNCIMEISDPLRRKETQPRLF
ncbi:SOS response-associated peptidase [Rhodopirellula sp.]|nr:SOS response-associated peptidase [Rhodopirellula sp.]